MKHLKRFEELNLDDSKFKVGNFVKTINDVVVGRIDFIGTFNDNFIYTIETLNKSKMKFYFEKYLEPASKTDIDMFLLSKAAEKYNL